MDLHGLLTRTATDVATFRAGLKQRPVAPTATPDELRAALGGPLPAGPTEAAEVIADLVAAAEPGLMATAGPRYFGFVIGGSIDAALAADVLAVGWDQNAFNPVTSLASAVVEEVAAGWLKELLGLPADAAVGFVPGGQGANTVALAAARHGVLAAVGHDVERDGLMGGPPIRVVVGEERHTTIDRSLRLLGLGTAAVEAVAASDDGSIDVEALRRHLASGATEQPLIVCLQAGNVNTGACDDVSAACEVVRAAVPGRRSWVHVDGAFGLWAAASPRHRHLVTGVEGADSWGVDGHKWLNVPQDCGYVICARPDDHAAALSFTAAYLQGQGESAVVNPSDFVMESSRRARGFATWAAIRQLGASGVAELVDRCCAMARRFAAQLDGTGGMAVVNDVVLNQVLVAVGDEAFTDAVVEEVQRDGTCWLGATTWRGRRLLRISVSNWSTGEDDVDSSVAAIRRAVARVRGEG